MGRKKSDKIKINFIGESASAVTGSMILIEYKEKKILIECGLYQSNNIKDDYKINSKKFTFKPKDIDYVFIGHTHIDHIGLLPRLYKEGCRANVITSFETVEFMPVLLKNSAGIMERDCEALNRNVKSNKEYLPIYDKQDVENACDYIRGYDINKIYKLDDTVSFELIPAGHIVGSVQIILYITKETGHISKILYTSDLGNADIPKPFVKEIEREGKANIVIGECTYGDSSRTVKKKDRIKDLEKLESVIRGTCVDRKGRVLIPSFSMDRTQLMLKILYDIFGEDENFDIPIIIDSPLSCQITDVYKYVLEGEDKELIHKICNWKNVRFINSTDDSKLCVSDTSPKVVLASSGMCQAGRVRFYLKSILPDFNSTLLFCGYASEGTLAWKIKNYPEQGTVSIDGKPYKNRCSITTLNSFSGHIQHDAMLKYYSGINTEAIYLVHGNMDDKLKFKKDLETRIAEIGRTTRVVCTNKGTSISI